MDYDKIGKFIKNERKAKKMTQEELANKIFVSEKTVSKWENGKGIPDTNTLPKLCEALGFTVNELLNGEKINNNNYTEKAENKLFELQKTKEDNEKRLLLAEWVIMINVSLLLLISVLISSFIELATWLRVCLIVFGFLAFVTSIFFAIRIEQKAGYYECEKCHHRYIPTYNQVCWSMHFGRTRYIKCPKCKQKSWNKKVL